MSAILDSGERREFSTGAVRDIQEGKGRCDLLPLSVVCPLMDKQEYANILYHIDEYMQAGYSESLYKSIYIFAECRGWSIPTLIMEVSKHYEEGALKYGEYNWQKGIPLHCYIDSAVRHFLKFIDGREDEPHDRAFIWNLLGALWTQANKPSMMDLKFPQRPTVDCNELDSEGPGTDKSNDEDTITVSKSKLTELLENIAPLSQQ